MKNSYLSILLLSICILLGSCKSEFERIRASSDPDLLYKKAFEYYEEGEYLKAQTLFELIINGLRGKVEAEKVYFYYAYTHYHLHKYILASYYFKNFSNTFSNSEFREEADFMTAYANYQMSPSYRLDQTYTVKAIEGLQLFVNTYPTSERLNESNLLIDQMRRKLERKSFEEAQLYFDLREYQSAVQVFENMLKDYPETTNAEKIRYMIIKAAYLLAENSIYEKKEERFRQAYEYSRKFIDKYPDSKYFNEINSINNDAEKHLKV